VANYSLKVTVPVDQGDSYAGLVIAHDGGDTFYAVVFNATFGLKLFHVVNGSWGSSLKEAQYNIGAGDYILRASYRQGRMQASLMSTADPPVLLKSFDYDISPDFGSGYSGIYSGYNAIKFDDFQAFDTASLDPQVAQVSGLGDGSLSSGQLLIEGVREQRSEAVVDGFSDDNYMVQTDVKLNSGSDAEIFVRYQDAHNAYRVRLDSDGNLDLDKVVNGYYTSINSTTYTTGACRTVTVNLSGTSIKVWVNGCGKAPSLKITATDSAIASGGVAFGGDQPKYDNLKIGQDHSVPTDGDMDDLLDYVIIDEAFGSTNVTYAYDHAGNLVSDGRFEYIYDAWNRLVKVQAIADIDPFPPVYQTAEFDGTGRRPKKVVTNSGEYDKTDLYLYNGHKIIETRDGSGNMVSQFIHGTQYIDELVMMRVKDKGDLYVHQDANWNVIGLTDLGGSLVERYDYTPYGTIKVHQLTSYGDRDGDNHVDSTDKGTPGTTCTGTVTGACRILDLDFDGDYDSADASKFDALDQGISQHPGRRATGVDQPFGHQGLLYDAELVSYQNRLRQYDPAQRRLVQRDPAGLQTYTSGHIGNQFEHVLRLARRGEIDRLLNARSALGTAQSNAIRRLERRLGRIRVDPKWLVAGLGTTGYLYNDAQPVDNQDSTGLCVPGDSGDPCHSGGCQLCGHFHPDYLYCYRCKFSDEDPGMCAPCNKDVTCGSPDAFNNCHCKSTDE